LPYLGVGAGAHGYIEHYRTVDALTPGAYIKKMREKSGVIKGRYQFPRTPATIELNPISIEAEIGETMMMGLRLTSEGVSDQEFQQRFRTSLRERFGSQIDHFISVGLLEWAGEQGKRLRLTRRGHLLGNQVFREFI
jgi:oxygen-independent coproporphyrinogen-3 oxidase